MQKTWFVQQTPEVSEISRLQEELKIPPIIAQLLLQRGITTFEEARSFFRPNLDNLHDPFLMKGMKNAVDRVALAQEKNEKILVFGDYDVDGTTAVALLSLFFKESGLEFDFYIPDRYKEGYGISIEGIDYARAQNCQLIVALDCGITAIEQVDYAKSIGIDFIVCDHHLPGKKTPNAIILNPKQEGCNYPYKELSGCGIGFKLAQALTKKWQKTNDFLYHLLDLVAIAIAADIVPVTGENRILAAHGLKQINSNDTRKGLRYLFQSANRTPPFSLTDLVFVIAPRINAAGRIDTGKDAVKILLENNDSSLKLLAQKIENNNTQRKELDKRITNEILDQVAKKKNFKSQYATVVCGENWHKGVIGIVASRIMETYYRPTIVLSSNGIVATGSVRSVEGFNVYEALKKCAHWLEQFGGHAMAAGLTLKIENLSAFQKEFEKVIANSIQKEQLVRKAKVDATISFKTIFTIGENPEKIPKLKRLLTQFEPTGPGNMKPVFLVKNVFIDQNSSRVVGENHFKLSLFQHDYAHKINAIGFNLGAKSEELDLDAPVDIVFTMEENTWNNATTLQLNIKDIRTFLPHAFDI